MGLVTIFYCLRFEISLFIASYNSHGYSGSIRPCLHTGLPILASIVLLITPMQGPSRTHCFQQYLYCCVHVHCCRKKALHATILIGQGGGRLHDSLHTPLIPDTSSLPTWWLLYSSRTARPTPMGGDGWEPTKCLYKDFTYIKLAVKFISQSDFECKVAHSDCTWCVL
jgi:hypothetical protein